MSRTRPAQFRDIASLVLPWITPDMRHTRYEAMMIYETLSYTLATFSLLQRQHHQLVRFRSITNSCTACQASHLWFDLNKEIGKIHRIAWQRFLRISAQLEAAAQRDVMDCVRPARRRILRDHLWTKQDEDKFDIFWQHTLTLRRRWRPDFILNPYMRVTPIPHEMLQDTESRPGNHSPLQNQ